MTETKATPISERTNESLVRTIAEYLKFPHPDRWLWGNKNEGEVKRLYNGTGDYLQLLVNGSADRERVMLASGLFWQHIEKNGQHIWSWYDMGDEVAGQGRHKDSGRAFCEAFVMWIEAQGDKND